MNTNTKPKREIAIRDPEPSVAAMLSKIIDKGITAENVQALDSLVGLYDRMQAKQAEKDFNAAFVAFQQDLPRVNVTKAVTKSNGSVLYRYAPLEDIEEVVKPIALRHGFTYSFTEGEQQPDRITKVFTIHHVGGHSRSNAFTVRKSAPPNTTDSQADGSTHSYAKRGAFCDGFGIIVDHDDDDARMIGKPIGKALAEDLLNRVKLTGSNMISFLKYAGVTLPPKDDLENHDPIEFFMQIPDDRFEQLDQILKVKEAKSI